MNLDPANRCGKEIVELHQFFEEWFNGRIGQDEHSFARFASVLAPSFCMVTPGGVMIAQAEILRRVYAGWASSRGDESPMRIWIENARVIEDSAPIAVMSYEEWQQSKGETRGRLSTAVFRALDSAPNGVIWVCVHETWLPH